MALIIFTPFSETTRVIATSKTVTSFSVPDISFNKDDVTEYFAHLKYTVESIETDTQYGIEHVFYIEKSEIPGALAVDPRDPPLGGNIIGGDPESYHPALWSYLLERFPIRTMLDVGCGEGQCVKYFVEAGVSAAGFDGLAANIGNAVVPILLHDLRSGPFIMPVDLVHCSEVVEHIQERYLNHLLTTLANGKVIAMTHAIPGQGGYHHVNCQPSSYWIERLEALGYTFLHQETEAAKARISESGAWSYFLQSGLILQKG